MRDSRVIAERTILFSEKNSEAKKPLTIRIFAPVKIIEDRRGGYLYAGDYECIVEFSEILDSYECHGENEIQAVFFASDIRHALMGLTDEYDFFFLESKKPLFDKEGTPKEINEELGEKKRIKKNDDKNRG